MDRKGFASMVDAVCSETAFSTAFRRSQVGDSAWLVEFCDGQVSVQGGDGTPPAVSLTCGATPGARDVFKLLAGACGLKATYRLWVSPDRCIRLPVEVVLHPEPDPFE